MAIFDLLSVSAIQNLISGSLQFSGLPHEAADEFALAATHQVKKILTHFTDHSQKLTQVLKKANTYSWQVLEIALAEESGSVSTWQRIGSLFTSADKKALANEARAFFQTQFKLPNIKGDRKQYYRHCLKDLHGARKAGFLTQSSLNPGQWQHQAGHFCRFVHRQHLLSAQQETAAQIAGLMEEAGYRHLGALLKVPIHEDQSLILIFTRNFFMRAIEQDSELFQGLAFEKLEWIGSSQRQGFDALSSLLDECGERLEQLLDSLLEVAVETREGVEQANQKLNQADEKLELTNQKLDLLLSALGLSGNRQVQTAEIGSRDDETNRQQVEQLRQKVQAMPATGHRQVSRVFNKLAKAELLTGNLDAAWQDSLRAAEMAEDPKERAEAHYNLYRIALEKANLSRQQEDWDKALNHLKLALNKDKQYMPFNVHKFQPVRILGAGGFGVTFLCQRKPLMDLVAVKSLSRESLDRDSDKVFEEGMLLRELDHPAIIRMIDGDYVDHETKSSPYLVMDYFDGTTLEDYVEKNGHLSQEEAIDLAKLIAEGLLAAHQRQIWHRDIKPANVMVKKEGVNWKVKIIDFGLALRRELSEAAKKASTSRRRNTVAGRTIAYTEDYAAPEQKDPKRQQEVGSVSDIYCFGKTIYYALFGTPRPDYEDLETLPESFKRLLTRCAAEKIERRPQGFTEILQELKKIEAELALTLDDIAVVKAVPVLPVRPANPPAPQTPPPVPPPLVTATVKVAAPPPVQEKEWYYAKDRQKIGPVTEAEIRSLLQKGQLMPTDLIWKKGLTAWTAASAALKGVSAPPPPPPPTSNLAQVRFFTPPMNWLEGFSVTEILKLYLDGQYLNEAPRRKGFDLHFDMPPGNHFMEVVAWNSGGEYDRKRFDLNLSKPGEYEIRFNFAFTPWSFSEAVMSKPGNIQKSTIDIVRQPR